MANYEKTIGWKNNNYTNIKFNKNNPWIGKVEQTGTPTFEKFEKPVYGLRAFFILMKNYNNSGTDTIREIISKFAPSTENDTQTYINVVAKAMGITPDSPVSLDDKAEMLKLSTAVVKMEIGYDLPVELASEAYDMVFSLKKKVVDSSKKIFPVILVLIFVFILYKFTLSK